MAATSKFSAKRSKPNYFFSILGVALVLFLLGILGVIAINARKLDQYFRERIEVNVLLRENTPQPDIDSLRAYLAAQPYTLQLRYITKDMAKAQFLQDGNDDWSRVLDYNPLPASLNFRVRSVYVNQDSLSLIARDLQQHLIVQEVDYPKALVNGLNENMQKIEIILLGVVILLIIVVIVLIDNTIKLAMFSNRFLIKTMQMVGATRGFIARPFDLKAVLNGLISAVLAMAGIVAIILGSEQVLPYLKALRDNYLLALMFLALMAIGIGITFLSTHRAVVKYLKMKLDDLY